MRPPRAEKEPGTGTDGILDGSTLFKTLDQARAAGFRDARPQDYGGETILLKGHEMVRGAKEAVSRTEWGRRGYLVQRGATPHTHINLPLWSDSAGWPVYRDDQVVPKKSRVQHEAVEVPILRAVWTVNRTAKRYRDEASHHYECGQHSNAKAASTKKKEMYRLKSQALHYLVEEDVLRPAGYHCFGSDIWTEVLKGQGYTFHRPCPPLLTPSESTHDAVEAKPKDVKEARLKDARHTVRTYLEGRPEVAVYEWPERPRTSRGRYYSSDRYDDYDDYDDYSNYDDYEEDDDYGPS